MSIPKPDSPHFADYQSQAPRPGLLSRTFPSLAFYTRIFRVILKASRHAKHREFTDEDWYHASYSVRGTFERTGVDISIKGTENIARLGDEPCLFIGNHMSTAETFLLASIILPFRKVTFVVKQALLEYPVFKHIMISRDPIVVGRVNPREDLKAVIGGGQERLENGISVIIFPQRTRTVTFDRESFNTIGVKLAKRAGVPVIPLALKTNAWSNGKWLKDFGPFQPGQSMRFEFGEPIRVDGNDRAVHKAVTDFIEGRLRSWGVPVKGDD